MAAVVAVGIVLGARVEAASGTDSFGYRWYDSTESECPLVDITISTLLTPLSFSGEDQVIGPVNIGFPFPFYGSPQTQVFVSTNGWLSFIAYANSYPNSGAVPSAVAPNAILAPFWADLVPADIIAGVITTPETYFVVRWLARLKGRTLNFLTETRLYPSGRVVHVYGSDFVGFPPADKAIMVNGIENAGGNFGVAPWSRGTGLNGYVFDGAHSLCFIPPPRLGCFGGPINCGGTVSGSTLNGIRDVNGYSCSGDLLDGAERAYTLTLANLTDIRATLSGIGGRDMRLFLVEGCDENRCFDGDSTVIDHPLLGAGTYAIAVDGPLAAEGTYSLDLSCVQRGFPASCGGSVAGNIGTGASAFDNYPCAPVDSFPGPESFYDLNLASATNLRAEVTASCNLDVFVLPAGDLRAESCLAHGQGRAVLYNAPAGAYVVVVEGRNGEACPYTIDFSCGVALGCGAPVATLGCGDRVSGTTVGRPDQVPDYACRDARFDGGEAVYAVTVPAGQSVGARLSNASSPDLEAFLLSSCNEGDCADSTAAGSACEPAVPQAGTWYVAVDGRNGASGTFDLEIQCGTAEVSMDWRSCELPDQGTTTGTSVASEWRWHTPVPSATNPAPEPIGSYCGTGCDFALWLPVNCGRSLHLSFDDAESAGLVSLTEVGSGRRANLSATNNGGKSGTDPWTATGAQLDWLSAPCTGHVPPTPPVPPDTGAADPRFNDGVVDVSFAPGENPCGLWRLDLSSMGGVHWGLVANCLGGMSPGYLLYDNICDAEAAFEPKAELEVSNLVVTGTCPDLTVSFDLVNLGCATVDAPWRIDAGASSIIDGTAAGLGPGALVTIVRSVTVGGSGRVRVYSDPLGALTECSEALGDLCGTIGVKELSRQACAGCGTPNPPTLAIGNDLRGRKQAGGAEMSWPTAPTLPAASATHFHLYRTDRKSGGTWTNLPTPDSLTAVQYVDAVPPAPLNLYQVRFANDCEEISGGALP